MASPSIVWFRDDLRLADNPALRAAIDRGEPVIGLYVLDEESPGIRPLGGAARWWLHHSLASLGERLRERGSALVLRRGPAERVVQELARDASAAAVLWNRRYGGPEREVDARIKAALRDEGLEVRSFAGSLLHEPWEVKTGAGTHFSVFTPFWRACLALPAPRAPLPEPRAHRRTRPMPASDTSTTGGCSRPTRTGRAGCARRGSPASRPRTTRLREFLDDDLAVYDRARDEPAAGATSMLSPRLRWGELSPYTVWHETVAAGRGGRFLSELGWREFAWHTLFHFPDLATRNLRPEFDAFPWPRLRPRAPARVAAREHRHPARRRRHARAVADGLHAQPRADGRRRRSSSRTC